MTAEVLKSVVDILTIIIALLPIGLQVFKLLTAKTHNTRLKNLRDRADVIVTGLERADLINEDKKQIALLKLQNYAKEVGIKVTPDQMDDYIESAYTFLKYALDKEE